MTDRTLKFDKIRLNLKPGLGQLKLIPSGIGWKANDSDQIFTIHSRDIAKIQWQHAARGYEIILHLKNKSIVRFDAFQHDDFDQLKEITKQNYQLDLTRRELSLKGWNWGRTEFSGSSLFFNVDRKPTFEIPLTEVANTNLASKNEVSIEFLTPEAAAELSGKKKSSNNNNSTDKLPDQLVEMRFYVPGTVTEKTKKAKLDNNGQELDDNDVDDIAEPDESDAEVQNAAAAFYELIKAKADVGQVVGGEIVVFQEILCLTPRGRLDVEMYSKFFRLRGKTNDYKVMYSSVVKLFSLKKPDDIHGLFVIALDPPLRQGQTRYPFLVLQFPMEDDIDVTLNMEEEELKAEFGDRVKQTYEGRAFDVVGNVFNALTKRSLVEGAKEYQSHHSHQAMKCSMKANEGYLYPLDKCFLFIPKPPTFIPYAEVSSVVFSRVGSSSVTSARMFDIKVNMLGGSDFQFSNINKEEYTNFKLFLKLKKIKTVDEKEDGPQQVGYSEFSDDDDDIPARTKTKDGDEDEESPDEDFVAESESDVAEEFNEDYSSSGSSEEENDASSGDEAESEGGKRKKEQEKKAPPKKRTKSGGK